MSSTGSSIRGSGSDDAKLRSGTAASNLRIAETLRTGPAPPLALVGGSIALLWFVIAIAAPLLAPYDPLAQDFPPFDAPTRAHLFGTDELGRDVFSRVIYGARIRSRWRSSSCCSP